MSAPEDNLALADRLITAITAGDLEGIRALYAPDAVIWHNNDGLEQSVEENLRVVRWVHRNIKDLRYEEIQRLPTPSGVVEQHVMRGVAPNGEPVNVPACVVLTLEDGRITRLDEYLDSAHLAALR